MKFCISNEVKQVIEKSEDYVFEKRDEDTWWLYLIYIEDIAQILKCTKKILSIELDEFESGDLLSIELFDDYRDMT